VACAHEGGEGSVEGGGDEVEGAVDVCVVRGGGGVGVGEGGWCSAPIASAVCRGGPRAVQVEFLVGG